MEKDKPPDIADTSKEIVKSTSKVTTENGGTNNTPLMDKSADHCKTSSDFAVNMSTDTPIIKRTVKSNTPPLRKDLANKDLSSAFESSPSSPTAGKADDSRDFRKLYYEMKKRVLKLSETNANNLSNTTTELDKVKKAYELMALENKTSKKIKGEYGNRFTD